ncbi:hypothetical protein [Chelativorans sp. J32]|uniref:hypothetical protein n=1 Tax=Chelativorans sp. J32 TaxID=935840 RepID=UPI0004869039|nr:hypothetical protein [Chelativorans sp. J32]
MTLYLEQSRPRKAFKNLLGNANHLIITALVGLDGIERGVVREVPRDLRTVWSPKDAVSSAKRSRRLILDMALIRAIDAIDVYLRLSVRKPALVQSDELRKDLDSAGLSVFRKLQAVERHCPDLDMIAFALVFLMVTWRNRSAHTEADRDAPERHLALLRSNAEEVAARFSGLDAEMLLGGYEAMRPVTFKEVASLINAAHHLVADLDALLLKSLDIEQFLKDVVWASLSDSQKDFELIEQTRKRRAVSVWGKDPSDRGDAVLRLLSQQGFSTVPGKQPTGAVIPADLIAALQRQTPKSVLTWAGPAN